jgi:MoaA/NifB/PqqE/SkfB family radical SAM enzyme
MTESSKKSFCVLPWVHSFINNNGAYQVCCTSEEYHSGIPDNNHVNFNISNRPKIDDVVNSEFMKNLRLQMLKGEWSEICTRCLQTERHEGVSRRNIENIDYASDIPGLISETLPDGAITNKFKSLDYRLGNSCNLQCRMCNPFSTEKWLKDWNEVKPIKEHNSDEQINYYKNFKWADENFLIEEMLEKLDGVERIHFAGGEPLLSPQMTKVLRECIALGYSSKIVISYNTNMTVLPKEILELWKEFKEIRLLCSVDGFGSVNDYIRSFSNWNIIDKNLRYLDENCKELRISEILLSCTVQIYNVLNLADLYSYVGAFRNIIPAVNLINLEFPDYLSTKVLPLPAKEIATVRLQRIAEDLEGKLPANYKYLVDNIYQMIRHMNTHESSSSLLIKFKKFNSKVDEKRKTKLSRALPELNKHLIDYYVENIL